MPTPLFADADGTASPGLGPFSFDLDIPSTDAVAYVGIGLQAGAPAPTGVTLGGVSMTQIFIDTSPNPEMYVYRLINPPSGTQTVVVSMSASAGNSFSRIGIVYENVNQTTPEGTPVLAEGTGTDPAVSISSDTDEVVLLFGVQNNPDNVTWTWDGSEVERVVKGTGGNAGTRSIFAELPGAATVNAAATLSVSDNWRLLAIPLKPSDAGGTLHTLDVDGGSTNNGILGVTVAINSLAGESDNSGILSRQTNKIPVGASTNSGNVVTTLMPGGGGGSVSFFEGSSQSLNSGLLVNRLNPTSSNTVGKGLKIGYWIRRRMR